MDDKTRKAKTENVVLAEIDIINALLHRYVDAIVTPNNVVVAGDSYIVYGVTLRGKTRQAHIRQLVGEFSEALSRFRDPADVPVRIRDKRPFGLEVPHPYPTPLSWRDAPIRTLPPMAMVLGRNYGPRRGMDMAVNLDDVVHVLVAGASGAGKTTLARTALCSLAYNTSPEKLGVVLIDPKKRDFLPLKDLPHVISFAHKPDEIVEAMAWLKEEMDRRTDLLAPPKQRILVMIAELREMIVDAPMALSYLLSLLSRGRSERMTVWGDTQYPTATELGGRAGGGLIKSSFGLRLVGKVAGADAANIAANRKGTGAESLGANGSWVLLANNTQTRIQSFLMEQDEAPAVVSEIRRRWAGVQPQAPIAMPVEQMAPVLQSQVSRSRLQQVDGLLGEAAGSFTEQDKLLAFDCLPIVREEFPALADGTQTKARVIQRLFEEGLFSAAYRGGRNARVLAIAQLLLEADVSSPTREEAVAVAA